MTIKNYFLRIIKTRHFIPVTCIVLGVVFANSIYLFTGANPNPIYQRATLTTSSTDGLFGGRNTIDPNDGFTSQALGHLAAKDWFGGPVPYWNHYEGVGTPLAGEMQSATFFPPTLLLGFSDGLLFFHILLEMIAGVATYYLLVLLKFNRKIAVFGGLAFAVNGTFAWLTNAAFNPVAFLPVLLVGIEMAYQVALKAEKRGWLLIAVAIALSLYAGFPETAYIDGLLGVIWAATRFFQTKNKTVRRDFAGKFVLGGVVGILLAAPIITAFYGYVKYANIGTHAGATTFGIEPIGLSNLLMPYIFGPIFGLFAHDASGELLLFWSRVGGYLTASLVTLAIIGAFSKREVLLKRVLSGWLVVTVLGTYGLFGIMHVLNLIPGIGSVAFYRYACPSFELAIVILAAFGVEELASGRLSKKVRNLTIAIMSVVIAAAVINAWPEIRRLTGAPHNRLWAASSLMIATGCVALVFLTQLIKDKRLRINALIVVGLLEVLVMFMVPQLSTPRHQQLDTQPVKYLQQNIGEYRFFTLGPIQPNYGSYYKISEININDLPIPAGYSKYITKNLNSNVNPLVFTGLNMLDPNVQTALQAFMSNFSSYEEVGVKYLVAPKGLVTDSVSELTGMHKVFTSPAADIFKLPAPKPYFEVLKGDCGLQLQSRDVLEVICKQPSTLLRREQFMKGWTAKAGSKEISVSEYNKLFQVVNLPAGTYDVTYNYAPPHILLAYLALALGLGLAGAPYVMANRPTPNTEKQSKAKRKG